MTSDKTRAYRKVLEEQAGILMAISVVSSKLARLLLKMSMETGKGEDDDKE